MAASALEAAPATTLAALAAGVIALADQAGLDTFDLVGHSMGGPIAMLVAASAPRRVRSLALLSPVPRGGLLLPEEVARLFRTSGGKRDAQGGILDQACLGLTPRAKEALLDDAGRIAPAWIAHAFDLWTRGADASALAAIVCPTLVIATDDPFLPHALLQEQVVDPIAGARLERLHGPGHYPQNERPEETSALLQAFWKTAGGAR